MMHLKTYENWFTNIFKAGEDDWQDYMDIQIGNKITPNWNPLFSSAVDGNWKRFKNLLPRYKNKIDDILIDIDDTGQKYETNLLMTIISDSRIGLWEKKKMISALIDLDVDATFINKNKQDFYDIMSTELKEWFDEKYPDFFVKLNSKKYNI